MTTAHAGSAPSVTAAGADRRQAVVDYYRATVFDYRWVLGLERHLGIHFGFYDDEHRTCPEAIVNMNAVLARKAGLRPGMRVLDAGCGIGGSSIWLARHTGARVTGVTLLELQRAWAEDLARRHGVDHLTTFLVADYRRTGLPASSFDLVWGLESVCYAEDKREFLREARRLLRPGGRLAIADGFQNRASYEGDERRMMESWLGGWAVPRLDTPAEFSASLGALGFSEIRQEDVTANVLPFSKWLARRAGLLLPGVRALRWLRLVNRHQLANAVAACRQYESLVRDLWSYWIFTARVPAPA